MPESLIHARGPKKFSETIGAAYAKAYAEAHPSQVDDVAARIVRNAGWYKTSDGSWKQLTPDLREKVNIRQAVKQPDNKYLIEDVDVFYPNRVKGDDPSSNYTPQRIREFIANTNTMINAGGQPPAIVREHPSADRKANGIPTAASGTAFGFKESPRGVGWARCNVLVDEPLYKEWRSGQWIGLSAGFACDKGGSNMRFGHIALLGADMQALSHLPRVEVFDSQLCFSADASAFQKIVQDKEPNMPRNFTDEQKKVLAKQAAAHALMQASFAAYGAGDEATGEAKENEAKAAFAANEPALNAAFASSGTDESNPLYDEEANTEVPSDTELDALLASEPPAKTDVGGDDMNHSAPNAEQFEALRSEVQILRAENANSKTVIKALVGKQMRDEFQQFMAKKQSEGHMFDASEMTKLFMAVADKPEAVTGIKRVIETSPKDPKTAGGPTFSAEEATKSIAPAQGAKPTAASAEVQETLRLLNQKMPGMNFSAEDVILGMVATKN